MAIKKIKCPYCNKEMSTVMLADKAKCNGIYIKCKNKQCKKIFEIKIP
nr:MAG TPA: cysteine-rich protein [Caudoviricetes sp.]